MRLSEVASMSAKGAIEVGVLLWSQGTDWPTFERAVRRVDLLGYAHLWTSGQIPDLRRGQADVKRETKRMFEIPYGDTILARRL